MSELDEIRQKKIREILNKRFITSADPKMEVSDSNFREEVLERSKKVPVVVDFHADWCMPCRIISPMLEKIAREYGGKFTLAKLDIQHSPLTSNAYNISSIPAVKMFKNGRVAAGFVGAIPENRMRAWLEENLN